jgi:hypothetical protein
MARIKIIVAIVVLMTRGCMPLERFARQQLNLREAAEVAAHLANDECEKHSKRRPFSPEDYKAVFRHGRWHWGKFDPAGVDGYSAEVSFKKNGSDPEVEVFFSSDSPAPTFPREERREELEQYFYYEKLMFPPEILDPRLRRFR